jgi:hypothetical protein
VWRNSYPLTPFINGKKEAKLEKKTKKEGKVGKKNEKIQQKKKEKVL